MSEHKINPYDVVEPWGDNEFWARCAGCDRLLTRDGGVLASWRHSSYGLGVYNTEHPVAIAFAQLEATRNA